MTACPGEKERGVPQHDARHVAVRLEVPWRPEHGPVRVVVVHRCDQWGCPLRLVDREEDARNPEAVLRKVLGPRGMLGCSHTKPAPVDEDKPVPRLVMHPEDWRKIDPATQEEVRRLFDDRVTVVDPVVKPNGKAYVVDDRDIDRRPYS